MAKKLLLWLESGMMMVLDFRIWIGLCFEQNFRIRIGFGYHWNFSERIGLSNFNIHTTLAGSEISYKEGSMESQIFWPRCFRDLLALTTVEAICQMYPPRVAARVAWEWAWFTGVNNWSKLTGILPQCNLCMNLPISRHNTSVFWW